MEYLSEGSRDHARPPTGNLPSASGALTECSAPGRVLQLNARRSRYANVMGLHLITAHGFLQIFNETFKVGTKLLVL